MSGLAEILEENARLRAVLEAERVRVEALERSLREKEDMLSGQNEALREKDATLREKDATLREKDATLREKDAFLAERDEMIEALKRSAEALAMELELLRMKKSSPASERFVPTAQEALPFPSDITAPPRLPVPEEPTEAPTSPRRKPRRKPRRRTRESLEHLPARAVRCPADPSATCVQCGGPLRVIGQAESFRVEWIPGHFVVEDVSRDKCACPSCPDQGVLTVPGPYALERALCGDRLLARVLVDKFADHVPLHRQARRMKRQGFDVRSNTLSSWIGLGAGLLGTLARAVWRELLAGRFLLGDDTGLPVQDGGDGKLRRGRLWAFTDQQQVVYAFTDTKEGKHPAALLRDFAGQLLLVDGGSEFNQVVRDKQLVRAGCWSHLRRYFFESRHHHPHEAALALGTLRDLFLIERSAQGRPPDEVLHLRRTLAAPLVDGFFAWAREQSTYGRLTSRFAEAITYALGQEQTLRVFLDHPELPMHNNLSELMLRQPVVGRKNWLFARSEGGAKAAADIYTLVGSCMLQGIDPEAYLVDVLGKLPGWPVSRVGALTPRAWREAREKSHGEGGGASTVG